MKKTYASLIIGGAGIVITGLLYYLVLRDDFSETMNWLSMIGVLLAEGITTALAYFTKGSPRRVAATGLSAVGIPIAFLLSLIFINAFSDSIVTYILLYVIFALGVNALGVVLLRFDATRNAANNELQQAKQNILSLRKMVKLIQADPAAADIYADLDRVEENLHFSNDAVSAPQDQVIYNLLSEMRGRLQDPTYDKKAAVATIIRTIEERNILNSRTV